MIVVVAISVIFLASQKTLRPAPSSYSVTIYDTDLTSTENYINGVVRMNFWLTDNESYSFDNEMFNIDDKNNGLRISIFTISPQNTFGTYFGPGVYNPNTENVEANGLFENISGFHITWSLKIPSTQDKRFVKDAIGELLLQVSKVEDNSKLWDENTRFYLYLVHPQATAESLGAYPQKVPQG
ncbi:MAG: hypothetical protein AB1305_02865 [Candidatus Hadarchaeota archaeon]